MSQDGDEKGFIIKDRRMFDGGGKVREDTKEESNKESKQEAATEEKKTETTESAEEYALPEINFPSFILSLHTSAMFHFGDIADPVSKKTVRNLAAAKQTIDILDMLQKKTSGNLDDGEKNLLDGILYELKMRYVKESTKS
jgi:PBP1b-binding outer membrane lipoprotein LpoB